MCNSITDVIYLLLAEAIILKFSDQLQIKHKSKIHTIQETLPHLEYSLQKRNRKYTKELLLLTKNSLDTYNLLLLKTHNIEETRKKRMHPLTLNDCSRLAGDDKFPLNKVIESRCFK